MLHLPRPYPDELVGSMLQRGRKILGLKRMEFLSRLTGHPGLRSHSQLHSMYQQLAHTYGLSFEEFVMQHTVLPYLMSFMQAHDKRHLLEYLLAVHGNYEPLAGLAVAGEQWLRRCPECVAAELREYGESYWHRVHQLSAVYVCVRHRIPLEWTSQAISAGLELAPPHESTGERQAQVLDLPMDLALSIANASAKALSGELAVDAFPAWRSAVEGAQLLHKFEQVYGRQFLLRYGRCLAQHAASVWPLKLLKIDINDTAVLQRILLHIVQQRGALDQSDIKAVLQRQESSGRDWSALEEKAIAILKAEVERHAARGTKVRLSELYALAGLGFLKHGKKPQMPRLMAWIENFRHSPQTARFAGGRRKN